MSDHISNDISTQMKILNMIIPILTQLCACLLFKPVFHLKPESKLHKTKCDLINDVKLSPTVYTIGPVKQSCNVFLTMQSKHMF